MAMNHSLTWVEISKKNLTANVKTFKKFAGIKSILCSIVKANAYGHGLTQCAPIILSAGADWLGVNALFEAVKLKKIGLQVPIYIMGYVPKNELELVVREGFQMVVYNEETLRQLAHITSKLHKPVRTHLKLETGMYRQGILNNQLKRFLLFYKKNPLVLLDGAAMHFANIEDTLDQSYALLQLQNFFMMLKIIRSAGFKAQYVHSANTAATILLPKARQKMIRVGIGNYGLWPSDETRIAALNIKRNIQLLPVMTWKTKIAQIKTAEAGSYVGYGCTYKAISKTRLAILPVGYYDGYDRGLSNVGYVLIAGKRAAIRGRVCMNITMVDVTNIPEAKVEDEAVLIGRQKGDVISAEQMADWLGTINYEVVSRVNERIERRVV